jgi:hypothetical protein
MSAALTSMVAVLGTLGGVLVTGLVQGRLARTARQESRYDARRSEALTAVTALVAALSDHRRAMWLREDLRLTGAAAETVEQVRAASHATRSAITAPLVTVRILTPTLAAVAQHAAQATYALREATDHATLTALRDEALCTADRLIESAGLLFTRPGAHSAKSARRVGALNHLQGSGENPMVENVSAARVEGEVA